MTNVQNFATHSFSAYASKNIRIDHDNSGLFASIPDQSGKWMTIRCVESKKSVHASHCSCHTFAQKQHCNHVELVQAYWNKIYAPKVEAPVVVETPAKKARRPFCGLVRKQRGGGLVLVAQPAPVAKIIELPVQPAKITDISTRGNLNGQRAFSILR